MNGIWGYLITSAVLPIGLPLLVAWMYTRIKQLPFQPYRLLGGGQLCFYSITLSLLNIAQIVGVQGADEVKPWAALVLGVVAVLASAVWVIGIAETLSPGSAPDETKRGITRYSSWVAGAAVLAGAMFRRAAHLL